MESSTKKCPHCQKEIVKDVETCPHCKSDVRSWRDRYIMGIAFCVLIIITIITFFNGSPVIFISLFFLYFFPSFYAQRENRKRVNQVTIVNLLLGWTLVGWVVALVWAMTPKEEQKPVTPLKDDSLNTLEKLAELKNKGIISTEEFEIKKNNILKNI